MGVSGVSVAGGMHDLRSHEGAMETDTRALIALDGLDEVPARDLDRIHSLLRMLNDFEGTLVVSSRWAGYGGLRDQWQEHCVDNLGSAEARKFFALWFGNEDTEGLNRAQAVLKSPSKAGLVEIPVLLGIVAAVAGEGPVPQSEAHVYARYVSLFLEGKWKPKGARASDAARATHLQAARALAWAMATGMTGLADGARWESVVTRADAAEYARAVDDRDLDLDTVTQLIRGHGLLVPIGRSVSEDHQEYAWLHRTVHEHLVGGYLVTRFRASGEALGLPIEVFAGATQWREPLRHFFGLLREYQQAEGRENAGSMECRGRSRLGLCRSSG